MRGDHTRRASEIKPCEWRTYCHLTDLRPLRVFGSFGVSFHLPSPRSFSHWRTSSSRVVPLSSAIRLARSSCLASALNVILFIATALAPHKRSACFLVFVSTL